MMETLVNAVLLTLLAVVTMAIARQRSLFGVVILAGVYSFLMASVLIALDAVDVAMTEASVGAGISTVILLATLHLTKSREYPQPRNVALPQPANEFPAVMICRGGKYRHQDWAVLQDRRAHLRNRLASSSRLGTCPRSHLYPGIDFHKRYQSTNARTPVSMLVSGRYPVSASSHPGSAHVAVTSPGCIGRRFRMALRCKAASIVSTKASSSSGRPFAMLTLRQGAMGDRESMIPAP